MLPAKFIQAMQQPRTPGSTWLQCRYLCMDGPEQDICLLEEGGHLQSQLQSLVVLLQGPLQPQPPEQVEGEM